MMMTESQSKLLAEAQDALNRGDVGLARRIAYKIAAIYPDFTAGWLMLAKVSSPAASIAYAKKAQELAPDDPQVTELMIWAQHRLAENSPKDNSDTIVKKPWHQAEHSGKKKTSATYENHKPVWIGSFAVLLVLMSLVFGMELIPFVFAQTVDDNPAVSQVNTEEPTPSLTPTSSPTTTPTPTSTSTVTPTAMPTFTSTADTTFTATPTHIPTAFYEYIEPEEMQHRERWIDIRLSEQRLYAYEGKTVVRSFLISSGTFHYPSTRGQFRIWIKLRFTPMTGDGYALANVPYTMYYHKDSGIHGTWWHNNFGRPMSRGCINMRTDEAEWLYNWAYVGTLVSVRR